VLRDEQECARMATAIKSNKNFQRQANLEAPEVGTPAAATESDQAKDRPWTEKEQRLLESGLVKFASIPDAKEKWRSIAAEIPGRSAKECLLRFKTIRAELLAKKEAPR